MQAAYMKISDDEFNERCKRARDYLKECRICPRECNVDRLQNEMGFCRTSARARISTACLHHGEEPPISGQRGSGTIFFSYCNMRCVFCQNYQISQEGEGRFVTSEELALMMCALESQGAHNINFVSPSHVVPQLVEAVACAKKKGLTVPLVYNSNGYDALESLKLLDGIIDIYMPDMKYADDTIASAVSCCDNYWQKSREAIKEMHRQVGPLICDKEGIAQKGLLVRHLVLPDNIAGSFRVLKFLAEEVSPLIGLSIMAQYHPCYKACDHPKLNRLITKNEYAEVLEWVEQFHFTHVFAQDLTSHGEYLPDFLKESPFE